MSPVLAWFRQAPRLAEIPALQAAGVAGDPVYPPFIRAPEPARLPDRQLRSTWRAPDDVLAAAGVRPGGRLPAADGAT